MRVSEEDERYLAKIFAIKRRRPAPRQSNFNVVSLITYSFSKSGDEKTEVGYVVGGNIEPSHIGGTVCAERSALSQLSILPYVVKLLKLYLVSDSPRVLQPGLLCREFLAEFLQPNQDLPIIMASENSPAVISSLRVLYPFFHLYIGVPRADLLSFAKRFSQTCEPFRERFSPESRLYDAVLEETARDARDFLHPLKYAAGVILGSGEIIVWHQSKLMEYGHTLDPVSFLVHQLRFLNKGHDARFIIQSDQFGVLHAPCAPARCQLIEHRSSFPRLKVILHKPSSGGGKSMLEVVPLTSLAVDYVDLTEGMAARTNSTCDHSAPTTPAPAPLPSNSSKSRL